MLRPSSARCKPHQRFVYLIAFIKDLPMTTTQIEKAKHFRTLHEGPGAFIIPNPWDAGTARMLTTLGFSALATTSAGYAFSLGRRDGEGLVSRDGLLQHIQAGVVASGQ